ncbi:hypothetical protein GXW82_20185 [Streptacidiphilus sp. 4-A2]|nr:hypothetical protein [Streptacidiphilus sp. 4-A2]
MWEVRAAPGALPELLGWVERQLADVVGADGRSAVADLYTAADDRIVVILRSPAGTRPARLPDPPAGLLARPAHQWPFTFHRHLRAGGTGTGEQVTGR